MESTSPDRHAAPMTVAEAVSVPALAPGLVEELYAASRAEPMGWTPEQFAAMLGRAAARRPEGTPAEAYLRGLHLAELALVQACARGYEQAWELFVQRFRTPLRQAAVAITRSETLGEELATSLYAELYGLKERGGERLSPLLSYSGRGSLLGWLRTTLAQRHVDRFRRTGRETPLGEQEFAADAAPGQAPAEADRVRLQAALNTSLQGLDAEERFLLAAYFLDGRTLLEIARLLRVHEATVSRKLKRLTEAVRKAVLRDLGRRGLSRQAAQEALGTDPRDLSLNLRKVLQTSSGPPFFKETGKRQAQTANQQQDPSPDP